MFVLDAFIVVFIPTVSLIETKVKLKSTLFFSLWIDYYFVIESMHVFSFDNDVVGYQGLTV